MNYGVHPKKVPRPLGAAFPRDAAFKVLQQPVRINTRVSVQILFLLETEPLLERAKSSNMADPIEWTITY